MPDVADHAAFQPGTLGPISLRNRVVKCGTNEGMSRDGLVTERGWPLARVALASTLFFVIAGVVGPPIGMLVDRFGSRVSILLGLALLLKGQNPLVEKQLVKAPERVIEGAVKGMLPRGPLGRQMFKKLKVFKGPEHDHAAQQPVALEINV